MRALVVKGYRGGADSLELVDVPEPAPEPGEVVIRVAASPVNPNDLLVLRDAYEVKKPIGTVAGFEGSGEVIAGSGFFARALVGRRVAFIASERSGTWAELAVTGAMQCVPLRKDVSDEQGSMMLTNPLTALVLVSRVRREKHRAFVSAAAAGALGQMIARLALAEDIPCIHVVRGATQVETMRALGATHVLDSSDPAFDEKLAEVCERLGATLALDPVGGELTGRLARALLRGGTVRLYGNLSKAPCALSVEDILFGRKRIEGFTMYQWLETTSRPSQFASVMRVQKSLGGPLATNVRSRVKLEDYATALGDYERAMSAGKIVFLPQTDGAR
ncbi:MAG TPA: zinc-binding dehydrogenase [Polyangiaceae bacterium]|jgi:NADPH:quinone reductase-like Zn-dependent oxidoreductase|nr:zinc-binding dehydrogenase [Polyangiaceae bacterium]